MPVQRCDAVDPFEAQGVDGMQGAELARLVPPAVRQGRKLGQFGMVYIGCVHGGHCPMHGPLNQSGYSIAQAMEPRKPRALCCHFIVRDAGFWRILTA